MFPDGVPGFGLLLLRSSAGVALVCFCTIHLFAHQEESGLTLVLAAFSLMCGLSLLLGLFNSLACSMSALISLGIALALTSVPLLSVSWVRVSGAFIAVIATALLCLGPGAYSLDARRHGRREIIIPARQGSSDDRRV
jgi:putative oxidoreductase